MWSALICRRLRGHCRASVDINGVSSSVRDYLLPYDGFCSNQQACYFVVWLILSFQVSTEVYNGKPNSNKIRSFRPQNVVL